MGHERSFLQCRFYVALSPKVEIRLEHHTRPRYLKAWWPDRFSAIKQKCSLRIASREGLTPSPTCLAEHPQFRSDI